MFVKYIFLHLQLLLDYYYNLFLVLFLFLVLLNNVLQLQYKFFLPNLLYISVTYLLSVFLLTAVNKLTPLHASGHGCSLCGSVFLPCLFLGGVAFIPGAIFFAAALWASVYLKRHTVREFLLGACCSALSALICYFFIHPTF